MKFQWGYYREPFRYIHKHNANSYNTFSMYNTRHPYSVLSQNKYLHSLVVVQKSAFFAHANKSGQYSGFTHDGLVTDKVTLFRVSVLRHGAMSMNRERYVIRTAGSGLSLIRKTRQSTRKFLPWSKGKSEQVRNPFLVPTTTSAEPRNPRDPDSRSIAFVTYRGNQWVLRSTRRSEGMRKKESLRCNDLPVVKARLTYIASYKPSWVTFKKDAYFHGFWLRLIVPIPVFNVNNTHRF